MLNALAVVSLSLFSRKILSYISQSTPQASRLAFCNILPFPRILFSERFLVTDIRTLYEDSPQYRECLCHNRYALGVQRCKKHLPKYSISTISFCEIICYLSKCIALYHLLLMAAIGVFN